MKKHMTLAAAFAALAFTAGAGLAQEVRIGVAAEPYPPFASPDAAGNWTGWEIDFVNAVCASQALTCTIVPVAWDGIIPALTGSQIDVIAASMSITAERAETIDFSDPYYNTPAVIVAATGSGLTADPEGLAGKIVGVQGSTIHQDYAQAHFPDSEIRIYGTQDEANQDVIAGRLDATLADSLAMADFVASEAGAACCEIVGEVADDDVILGPGIGFGTRKGEADLLAKLNAGIAAAIADGTHAEITSRYFTVPIL